MDKSVIMAYAGLYLHRNNCVDAKSLQRFIMNKEEVGKPLPIEDIEEALNILYIGYFITYVDGKSDVYVRDN